jgi:hypothetical protein
MFEALFKYFSTYVPTIKYNSCDQSYVLQEKKFQSAYLKCMSKLTLDGYTTGEHLYSDKAAKEARTKLFSMWYSLGPP